MLGTYFAYGLTLILVTIIGFRSADYLVEKYKSKWKKKSESPTLSPPDSSK